MIERPILFKGEMVRAILDGTKTQTRRIIPESLLEKYYQYDEWCDSVMPSGIPCSRDYEKQYFFQNGRFFPGDRLWVRESWDFLPDSSDHAQIVYWADGNTEERDVPEGFNPMIYSHERVRPSIHMPRWASRITLEIVSVRVERLQDITEEDAKAEGIEPHRVPGLYRDYINDGQGCQALPAFASLWESINGEGSWEKNPWVWVIEFKRHGAEGEK